MNQLQPPRVIPIGLKINNRKNTTICALLIVVTLSQLVVSCSTKVETEATPLDWKARYKDSSSTTANDTTAMTPIRRFAEGMEVFTNMEFIAYCLPLPIYDYEILPDEESVKAQHQFVHKKNRTNMITTRGLMREDTDVSFTDYFTNSVNELVQSGNSILTKEKFNSFDAFYVRYTNKKKPELYYLKMVWLRKDEVITLDADYFVSDSAKWTGYIVSLMTVSSECE